MPLKYVSFAYVSRKSIWMEEVIGITKSFLSSRYLFFFITCRFWLKQNIHFICRIMTARIYYYNANDIHWALAYQFVRHFWLYKSSISIHTYKYHYIIYKTHTIHTERERERGPWILKIQTSFFYLFIIQLHKWIMWNLYKCIFFCFLYSNAIVYLSILLHWVHFGGKITLHPKNLRTGALC